MIVYRVFDKRAGVERMWVYMVGMSRGRREGGMGRWMGAFSAHLVKMSARCWWAGIWRGREVVKPTAR